MFILHYTTVRMLFSFVYFFCLLIDDVILLGNVTEASRQYLIRRVSDFTRSAILPASFKGKKEPLLLLY